MEEMQITDDKRGGLVLVNGITEGSNAEKCGLFKIGDALISIGTIDSTLETMSLEGKTFDQTINIMGKFADQDVVVFAVRRLLPRNEVDHKYLTIIT